MKYRVLGCSGGQVPGHNLSSYMVDDSLLIDAGSASAALNLKTQRSIRNVLITHVHLDHVLGLATIVDNLYGAGRMSINVYGSSEVITALKSSLFNDTIWPDFTQLTCDEQPWPVISLHDLREGKPVTISDFIVTMVRVNHIVPSTAFFVENGGKTLLHVGDTGSTERVWKMAQNKKNLCGVVVEASFPNRLEELAHASRHLSPKSLREELRKLGRPSVPILVTHLKPQYRREIIGELKKIKSHRLRILKDGDTVLL